MKGLIIGGGIILSIVFGFLPKGATKAKPARWRWLAIVSMLRHVLGGLGIPTGGSFNSAKAVAMGRGDEALSPVQGTIIDASGIDNGRLVLEDEYDQTAVFNLGNADIDRTDLKEGTEVILASDFD